MVIDHLSVGLGINYFIIREMSEIYLGPVQETV